MLQFGRSIHDGHFKLFAGELAMAGGRTPYQDAEHLAALFRHFEYVLKRSGFLRRRRDAQADWRGFAVSLGDAFFSEVQHREIAKTLLLEPPRTLVSETLRWEPEKPEPLANVEDLFVKGVCKVRNSYIHGEKFIGGDRSFDRDSCLVREALAVLELARPLLEKLEQQSRTDAG